MTDLVTAVNPSSTGASGFPLAADQNEITAFVDLLFKRCKTGDVVLRSFLRTASGAQSVRDHARVPVNDRARLIAEATRAATQGANLPGGAWTFAPPVATFRAGGRTTEADIAEAPTLSADLDEADPDAARATLEALLGPATAVVASGGVWRCPTTGRTAPKLHLHWRLAAPATTPEEIALLKRVRKAAAQLVGGDASGAPASHPYRWVGSWHLKGRPTLARIVGGDPSAEIDLHAAASALGVGTGASAGGAVTPVPSGFPPVPPAVAAEVAKMVRGMSNAVASYSDWLEVVHAIKTGLGGDETHYQVFEDWCLKWPGNTPELARQKWDSFTSPATLLPGVEYFAMRYGDWSPFSALPPLPDDEWLCAATRAGQPVPPRRWLVPGWVPLGHVTALFGPGGVGKSLFAQQLATAVGAGKDFLGVPVASPGAVVAMFCEDDPDELARRQNDICGALSVAPHEVSAVHWQARAGQDNALVRVSRDGVASPTALFDKLSAAVNRFRAKLVIIDNIAQMFHGNENVRAEVTSFANMLTAIARDNDCAVLLLGHPAKGDGSEYSGSTAWDAAVRTRLYFGRPADTEKDPNAAAALRDIRTLRRSKSNYAASGDEIACRYNRGAFEVIGGSATASPAAAAAGMLQQVADDAAFLAGLAELDAMGLSASHNPAAHRRYAPTLLRIHAPAVAGVTRGRLEAAMRRLLVGGQIRVGSRRDAARRPQEALEATGKPVDSVANLQQFDAAHTPLIPPADPFAPCSYPAHTPS